jgi:hypothetical protein
MADRLNKEWHLKHPMPKNAHWINEFNGMLSTRKYVAAGPSQRLFRRKFIKGRPTCDRFSNCLILYQLEK